MAMNSGGNGGSYQSHINVTPLVDVVLVLLIMFMVIVPLPHSGYDLDVPELSVAAARLPTSAEQIILSIDTRDCAMTGALSSPGLPPGCEVSLGDEKVAVADLGRRMSEIYEGRMQADRILFLSAEDRLNYEGVMRIVDAAGAGVEELRIGLVPEQRVTLSRSPMEP